MAAVDFRSPTLGASGANSCAPAPPSLEDLRNGTRTITSSFDGKSRRGLRSMPRQTRCSARGNRHQRRHHRHAPRRRARRVRSGALRDWYIDVDRGGSWALLARPLCLELWFDTFSSAHALAWLRPLSFLGGDAYGPGSIATFAARASRGCPLTCFTVVCPDIRFTGTIVWPGLAS